MRIKYKGYSYKNDNYIDQLNIGLNVTLTLQERKSYSTGVPGINVQVGTGSSQLGDTASAAAERADRSAAERADRAERNKNR